MISAFRQCYVLLFLLLVFTFIIRGAEIVKSRSHLKILGNRWVTCSKFHPNDPQILSARAQNLVVQVIQHQDMYTAIYPHSVKHCIFLKACQSFTTLITVLKIHEDSDCISSIKQYTCDKIQTFLIFQVLHSFTVTHVNSDD